MACAMCGDPLAEVEMQLRSADEASTTVRWCHTCGSSGSLMRSYRGMRTMDTIWLSNRKTRSATRPRVVLLPRLPDSTKTERVAWLEIYSKQTLRSIARKSTRCEGGLCTRYSIGDGVSTRTATTLQDGAARCLRGWEYSADYTATYSSIGSTSSSVRILEEVSTQREELVPKHSLVTSTRCMYIDVGIQCAGELVLDYQGADKLPTRAMVPILKTARGIVRVAMEILLSLVSDADGLSRVTVTDIKDITGMANPLVLHTMGFLSEVKVLVIYGDVHFTMPVHEIYPDSDRPARSSMSARVRINRVLQRKLLSHSAVSITTGDCIVAILTDPTGLVLCYPVDLCTVEKYATEMCQRVGGSVKWKKHALMLGTLPPLCSSASRLSKVSSYGSRSEYMGERYVGLPTSDVISAVADALLSMSQYSMVTLVSMGEHNWVQVERYCKKAPMICVSRSLSRASIPRDILSRLVRGSLITIHSGRKVLPADLSPGLYIMKLDSAKQILSGSTSTPAVCVYPTSPVDNVPSYNENVSVVVAKPDVLNSTFDRGYEIRHVRLCTDSSMFSFRRSVVLCKGWIVTSIPWILEHRW